MPIKFSDNPNNEIYQIRTNLIKQNNPAFTKEDFEDLFRCEITDSQNEIIDIREVIKNLKKEIKKDIIKTSPDFSFYDIGKIFNDKKLMDLFKSHPYLDLKYVPTSYIPKGLVDKHKNNVYEKLLMYTGVTSEDLANDTMVLHSPIERNTLPNKLLIDTKLTRKIIVSKCKESCPSKSVYTQALIHIFQPNINTIVINTKKEKNNIIANTIKDLETKTYDEIGKIFGRSRMQIRDIARDHGIYRYNKGIGRVGIQHVSDETWVARKQKNKMKDKE